MCSWSGLRGSGWFFRFEEAGDLHDSTLQDQCAPDAHNYVQMREGKFAGAG